MKKLILLFLVICYISGYAQVGINADGSTPDGSAMLDVKSTNQGLLPPRVADTSAISNPIEGLLVYDLSSHCMRYYNGTTWSECMGIYIWSCGNPFTINHVATGGIAPVDKSVTYSTVTNIPGEPSKCWITRNLGASQQATSVDDATEASAGWYWQFNRKQGYMHDGITRTPNTTWINSINDDLNWQAENDPCSLELGSGWHIPTYTEWNNVNAYWTNWNYSWNSGLKMHAAGWLNDSDGSLSYRDTFGFYWSSNNNGAGYGWTLVFFNSSTNMTGYTMAHGIPLRCLRDL